MKIIDISIPINNEMIVWEDNFKPEIKRYSKLENGDVSNTSYIKMDLHTGTHIDFPFHFLKDGKTSNDFSLNSFILKAHIIKFKGISIDENFLKSIKLKDKIEAVLFKTNNYVLYKKGKFSTEYTHLTFSGAQYLIKKGIKLVGIDYLSIEKYGSRDFSVHKTLLKQDILILENLNLTYVKEGIYQLYAIPIKIEDVEALPARAFLIEDEKNV